MIKYPIRTILLWDSKPVHHTSVNSVHSRTIRNVRVMLQLYATTRKAQQQAAHYGTRNWLEPLADGAVPRLTA